MATRLEVPHSATEESLSTSWCPHVVDNQGEGAVLGQREVDLVGLVVGIDVHDLKVRVSTTQERDDTAVLAPDEHRDDAQLQSLCQVMYRRQIRPRLPDGLSRRVPLRSPRTSARETAQKVGNAVSVRLHRNES